MHEQHAQRPLKGRPGDATATCCIAAIGDVAIPMRAVPCRFDAIELQQAAVTPSVAM
ncbi:hypothetical protein BSIN_0452 [Burkholderia singularis]|uniref:Uncharacterized protein n=1 Tax=Burkholderia singularis TaxID=1503053 RepID=A0A238H6G1_9BURK|nr:hypothetical protein BSIN_0452 [Burkholderia singularis]